jgi:hypothetical protein
VDKRSVSHSGPGSAIFNYTVVATKSAAVDSAFTMTGDITVFNSNDTAATAVSVADDVLGFTDETCTVTGGDSTVAAGASEVFQYSCTLPTAAAGSTGTNQANVTWDQSSIGSPGTSTTATALYDFGSVPTTVVGNCTTVTDTFGLSGSAGSTTTLGSPCATATYTYARTIAIPATGCLTYDNTARLSSGASASASVRVCRLNSDGYTMGYWQNKNGQGLVGTNYAGLCTYLAAYPNVLTLPTSCTANSLKSYVNTVINAANASGTGAPMFKGQFLATALSAYFSHALAATSVVVPGSLLGTSNCITVANLLTAGNASYAALSANKVNFMAVKDVYDHINNNIQLTC